MWGSQEGKGGGGGEGMGEGGGERSYTLHHQPRYLSAAAAAMKVLDSPGRPRRSEHRRADALQYCFGLNKAASAIWCA